MDNKKIISKAMSELAKRAHKKKPRSKEFYRTMQAKSVAARKDKKLSTAE